MVAHDGEETHTEYRAKEKERERETERKKEEAGGGRNGIRWNEGEYMVYCGDIRSNGTSKVKKSEKESAGSVAEKNE